MAKSRSTRIRRPSYVLMTADTVGGVWDYSLELARGLSRRGVITCLATMGRPLGPAQRATAATVPYLEVIESAYKLEWMDDSAADVRRSGEWLLQLERRLKPDIVHLNGYAHAALPFQAPVLAVAHSCVASWWRAVHGGDPPPAYDSYRQGVRAGLDAADLVVAPTQAMLDALRDCYGTTGPASRVIRNGRDPNGWRATRKEHFVLSVGRLWDEGKNIARLAETAPQLDWPVLVAGEWRRPDGGGRAPPNVTWLGQLTPPVLATCYSRAAIYCLPARYEPFGLSVLEAALSGCALVLGDIPSLRELWEGAALFVAPDDAAGLTGALNRLARDTTLRDGLAEAAFDRAHRYDVARMTDAYLDAYAALFAEGSRASSPSSR